MCLNDVKLNCESRDFLTKRQRNLCNEQLAINRSIVTCALGACKSSFKKPVRCLEGIGICGINGFLWEKYFDEEVDVTINGVHEEDAKLVSKNLHSNGLKAKVLNEDPCVLFRKECYDFVFLNCSTKTSQYLDSVFSNIKNGAVLIITTSEDSSLYWQMPETALRNYGGTIVKTSYHHEVAIRLVVAEMARACARYNKGLKILFSVGYKPQQSFTIVAKVKKGSSEAIESIKSIKKLAYCNLCENQKFLANSTFIDKMNFDIGCDCSKNNNGKVVIGIGPLWTDEIFNSEFIESMIQTSKELSFENKVFNLLNLILEEARCFEKCKLKPPEIKRVKLNDQSGLFEAKLFPYFYFNTHRHSPKELRLQKPRKIVHLLQNYGYFASRTHFDPEGVRTNATLSEYVKILRNSSMQQKSEIKN